MWPPFTPAGLCPLSEFQCHQCQHHRPCRDRVCLLVTGGQVFSLHRGCLQISPSLLLMPSMRPHHKPLEATGRQGSSVFPNTVTDKPHSPDVIHRLTETEHSRSQGALPPRISRWVLPPRPRARATLALIFLPELKVFKGLLTLNYLCLLQVQIISAILQNKFILPTSLWGSFLHKNKNPFGVLTNPVAT